MRLVYEYTNTLQDYLTQHGLCNPDAYHIARRMHYRFLILPLWAMLLGVVAALLANNALFAYFIIAAVGFPLCASIPFAARYRWALERSLGSNAPTEIRLEVAEDGMHETVEGIQSFAPWSSVRRFEVFHETIFVALAANRWAIIPRRSLSPSSDRFGDLIRVLQERTVMGHSGGSDAPEPSAAARPTVDRP